MENLEIVTYTCVEQTPQISKNGTDCYCNENTIFLMDRYKLVKVGDIVKIEINENGFYKRIWVNDILKAIDYHNKIFVNDKN